MRLFSIIHPKLVFWSSIRFWHLIDKRFHGRSAIQLKDGVNRDDWIAMNGTKWIFLKNVISCLSIAELMKGPNGENVPV